MFSDGYGFVVDYLAEILRALRNHDFSDRYKAHFKLSDDISTRDRDGINKTFSGLMKVIYPHGDASAEEIEALLRLAIEGRKRVKDQLLRIDSTYPAVRFTYTDQQGNEHEVRTLEEDEYPAAYHQRITAEVAADASSAAAASMHAADSPTAALTPEPVNAVSIATPPTTPTLREQHLVFQRKSARRDFRQSVQPLFGRRQTDHRDGPVPRMFHQQRNLMELWKRLARIQARG
jgi:ATP-dependent Lon protease